MNDKQQKIECADFLKDLATTLVENDKCINCDDLLNLLKENGIIDLDTNEDVANVVDSTYDLMLDSGDVDSADAVALAYSAPIGIYDWIKKDENAKLVYREVK